METGKLLRKWRAYQGYSLEELGKQCNLTRASLSQIENGVRLPPAKTMKTIVSCLSTAEARTEVLASYGSERVKQEYKSLGKEFKLLDLDIGKFTQEFSQGKK